ncbi:hypothetical protein NP233_g7884 [Leucocoprinus birnbaumii]|uniref:Uncharacterized protein n=1 Tax=Leucocoprinus birnbaumii TaxID=56174 RepID=A0AAD5YNK8_9AGAR|nr:hypothetical protein NP233_g7884 [Leucocoprinus birnbaumii]
MQRGFLSLCDDILYLLGRSLYEESPEDVLSLMVLSIKTRDVLVPIIYSSVRLRGSRQCTQTLRYLKENPWIASYVRQLAIDTGCSTQNADAESSEATEDWISSIVEELAPHLKRLSDFRWDGSRLPLSRTFWETLQKDCLELKDISTSISQEDPLSWDENTSVSHSLRLESLRRRLIFLEFLKLRDLRRLSVKIKKSSAANELPNSRYLSKFPPLFWSIIHPSCSPRLENLSFETDVLRSFNFNALFALELPTLRRLTIGSFVFSDFAARNLVEFLQSAHSIEHLDLAPVARIPWTEISFPGIHHYGGNIFSIFTGATHWPTLASLDISCFPLSFERTTAFLRRSSKLPSLICFKLRVTSEDGNAMQTNSSFFGGCDDAALSLLPALSRCYPNLQSLHILSSAGSTLPWKPILLSLREFLHLSFLDLTQVPPRIGDEISSLAKIALSANKNLSRVRIQRSLSTWFNISDCIIGEKVEMRCIGCKPIEVASQYIDYRSEVPKISRTRFPLKEAVAVLYF